MYIPSIYISITLCEEILNIYLLVFVLNISVSDRKCYLKKHSIYIECFFFIEPVTNLSMVLV